MLDYKISGLAELDRALQQFPDKLARNVLRGGLRAGGKVIATEACRLVSVEDGDLQDSIRVSSRIKKGIPTASVKAGNDKAFYAHMVEKGTAAHFIKPMTGKSLFFAGIARTAVRHPGAKKKPFMRPAADTKAGEALQAFADYARARIEREGINVPDPVPEDVD